MTINQRKEGDVTILQVQGRLDSTTAQDADRSLATLIGGGTLEVVLDLSGLEYVSSAGLRVFLSAAKRMKQAHGKLALASPAPQVKQVLDIAGFSTFLPIFATMAEAVGSCTTAVAQPEPANTALVKLTVAEEILLLALDDKSGVIKPVPSFALDYALAAALLAELELSDRIDTDLKILKLISPAPTGEPLLDETLLELQQKTETQPTSFWLERLTIRKKHIEERVLAQLVRKGILKQENRRILWVFKTHRYPLMDDREVKEVRTRLRELILSDDIPDPRDVVLISLGNACRLLDDLFTPKEKERVHSRITALARLDLIGDQLATSIQEIERTLAISSIPNI
ncbi:MAG: anti-sigma factor antagonist [Victivallales bacterium]